MRAQTAGAVLFALGIAATASLALLASPSSDVEPPISDEELRASSLVGGKDCPPAPQPLYRCVTRGFFTPTRVLRNLLGDELAEHPSWNLTSILREAGHEPPTLDEYRQAKREEIRRIVAEKERTPENPCRRINQNSMSVTAGMAGRYEDARGAMSILASDGSGYAENYCLGDASAALLTVRERIPRAAYTSEGYSPSQGQEYAIPAFIPADELVAAHTAKLWLEKTVGPAGSEIVIHRRKKGGFNYSREGPAKCFADCDPAALFRIVECANEAGCDSDPSALAAAGKEIPTIRDLLSEARERGRSFKVVP